MSNIKERLKEILERVGDYLQLDLMYFIKGGFYLSSVNVISVICGLFLSMAFSRFVPKETFGQYTFILSVMSVLSIFALPGMGTAIIQAVARGYDGTFVRGLKERVKWSMLGNVLILMISAYYFAIGNVLLASSFLIALVFFSLYYIRGTYSFFLHGKKMFRTYAKYMNIFYICSITLLIPVIYFFKDLWIILFAQLFIYSLIEGYFLIKTLRSVKSTRLDKESITYGKHLSIMNALPTTALHLDKILIATFLSFEELAVYAFAILLPEQIKSLIKNVATLALPKLSIMDNRIAKKTVTKRFIQFMILNVPIVVAYILLAPSIYLSLFPQYLESVSYSQLFMISAIPFPLILITTLFQSKKRVKELYTFNTLMPVFQIIALVILTPLYGLFGVVIARIATRFFGLAISLALFRNFLKE